MRALSPREQRIIAYQSKGPHKCIGAKIGCCGKFRCETCHLDHLRAEHSPAVVQQWLKLAGQISIIQHGYKEKKESSPKKTPAARKAKLQEPTMKGDLIHVEDLNDEQAEDFYNFIMRWEKGE